jgi:membrane-associated phospholipid phosphatase
MALPHRSPLEGDHRARLGRRPIDKAVAVAAIAGFVVGSAIWISQKGLFVKTDTVVLWVLAGLFALTLTDLRRWGLRLFWDWLPLGALLVFYGQSALLAKLLHSPLHAALQIHFDEFLFGKPLLTIQLQHLFDQTTAVRWWEYPMFVVYMTHFFIALVVAGILWRFAYERFRDFRIQIVILSTLGFATYVLYPAAPPWYMGDHLHVLPTVYRTVFETWGKLGLESAGSIADGAVTGTDLGNRLAAVPSMHAAITLFIACFFWRGARLWVRVALVMYVLAMAFTLVYSGEHYLFDIIVGWLYAAVTVVGVAVCRRYARPQAAAIVIASDLPLAAGGSLPTAP